MSRTYTIPIASLNDDGYQGTTESGCTLDAHVAFGLSVYGTSAGYWRFYLPAIRSCTILSAYISYHVFQMGTGTAWTPQLRFEAVDDSASFAGQDLRGRAWGSAVSLSRVGMAVGWNNSPSLTSAIQALVNRAGFGGNIGVELYYNDANKNDEWINVSAHDAWESIPANPAVLYVETSEAMGADQFVDGLGYGLGRGIR